MKHYFSNSKPSLILRIDIHWNILQGFDTSNIWERSQRLNTPLDLHSKFKQLSADDAFWYLASKSYLEAFHSTARPWRLRQLFDLAVMQESRLEPLSVEYVFEVANQYSLEAPLYFVCLDLVHTFKVNGLDALLEKLRTCEGRTFPASHNGFFLMKMLGSLPLCPPPLM